MPFPKPMATNIIALLVLSTLAWLLLCATLSTVVGATSVGDQDIFLGLRWIFAGVMVGVIWLCLGGILLVYGGGGVLPQRVNFAALLLAPLSAPGAFAALYLVSETSLRWPLAIPVGIPVLLFAYLIAIYRPSPALFHPVVWTAVCVAGISVWPSVLGHRNQKAQARVERVIALQEYTDKETVRKHEENRAKLEATSTDQHISDWFNLFASDSGVRDQALVKFRTAARRQTDVEEGLGYGIPVVMSLVPELDIQPTPKLCTEAREYLVKAARSYRLKDRAPYPYEPNAYIDGAIPAIQWFRSHDCNCEDGVNAIRTVVLTYLDSPDRQKLLAGLNSTP